MPTAAVALRAAIHDALVADSALAALLGGARIYDEPPESAAFPYVTLGECRIADWSTSIDAIGIDYYAPLSDWRDGAYHLDRALTDSIYDRDYLGGNLSAGEGYDWYYADAGARGAQTRTPITDGLGKPWVFRAKDLWAWWSNAHYERVDGVELGSPTAWTAESKPIWLTEIGVPAVDKGTNQPSVFPDPKSSESGVPYYSDGARDDLIQRRALEAALGRIDRDFGASSTDNPISPVYGGRMFDASAVHLWTWDARPYPAFPALIDTWADGGNWETGHWLTGRLGAAPLDALVETILADCSAASADTSALIDSIDGYLVDRPMPPRAMLEPLALAYAFEALDDGEILRFKPRGGEPVIELSEDDLVLPAQSMPYRLVRAQESERCVRRCHQGLCRCRGHRRRGAGRSV